jgi:hypothetical protein
MVWMLLMMRTQGFLATMNMASSQRKMLEKAGKNYTGE